MFNTNVNLEKIVIKKCELIKVEESVVYFNEIDVIQHLDVMLVDLENDNELEQMEKSEKLLLEQEYKLSDGEKFVVNRIGANFYYYLNTESGEIKFSTQLNYDLILKKEEYSEYRRLKHLLYKKVMGIRRLLKDNYDKIKQYKPEKIKELYGVYENIYVDKEKYKFWENEYEILKTEEIFGELHKFKDYIWDVIKDINHELKMKSKI